MDWPENPIVQDVRDTDATYAAERLVSSPARDLCNGIEDDAILVAWPALSASAKLLVFSHVAYQSFTFRLENWPLISYMFDWLSDQDGKTGLRQTATKTDWFIIETWMHFIIDAMPEKNLAEHDWVRDLIARQNVH